MFSKGKNNNGADNYDKHYINQGMEDEMEVIGYRRCSWYEILSWLGIIFTLGFLRLVFVWIPRFHLACTHKKCPLAQAEKLLAIESFNTYKTFYIEVIKDSSISLHSQNHCKEISSKVQGNSTTVSQPVIDFSTFRSVNVKKNIYIWVDVKNEFLKLTGLGSGLKNLDFYNFEHLTDETHSNLKTLYGPNEIYVPVQSYLELILSEITNPFYIFQAFSITFWFFIAYYLYTVAIIVFTILSIFLSVRQIHQAQENLSKTVHASDAVYLQVRRADGTKQKPSKDLVPGDTIIIESNTNCTMPCDAILLSGTCIVNESMLTGESVPLTKTALAKTEEAYQEKESSNHILFSGTKVIQTRKDDSNPVLALVIRTGYSTAKGNLVRSILYPPPVDYKFESGVYKFITIIGVLSAFAAAISAGVMISNKKGAYDVVTNALQLLTNVIPAALPGAMTLSKVYAVRRLKKERIYCINSRVVNVAGSVDCVCFDKTGTITEDGLDVWGVVPVIDSQFRQPVNEPKYLDNSELKYGMASCHSLSLIEGRVSGDPLDEKMFESTGWLFVEPQTEHGEVKHYPSVHSNSDSNILKKKISIIHQYQFISKLQRMSVVVKIDDDLTVFTKGSPEMIASLSKPETVPSDFTENLNNYAKKGFRVLALGCKKIDNKCLDELKSVPRNSVETDLEFLGFLVLENKIKKESKEIIKDLNEGKFKIAMITGDNILTAVSVAKECNIVAENEVLITMDIVNDEISYTKSHGVQNNIYVGDAEKGNREANYKIALTGHVWEKLKKLHPEVISNVVAKGAIFARVSSDQKQQIVLELQTIGYCVMMCGDGANDCSALKAANVGISLSEAEASVASPLTSADQNIACAVKTVREGRAALTTSFGLIKFLMIYCLVQFLFTFICNSFGEFATDYEYLIQDVLIAVHFAFHFGRTGSYKGPLAPETPLTSILDFSPLFSIAGHFVISLVFQLLAVYTISLFPWFKTRSPDCHYNNYALYMTSLYQLVITVISVSRGTPYRRPLYTNYLFTAAITIVTCLILYATLLTPTWISNFLDICQPPDIHYPLVLISLVIVNFLLCVTFEKFLIDYILFKRARFLNCNESRTKRKYIQLEQETFNFSPFDKRSRTFDNNGIVVLKENETTVL